MFVDKQVGGSHGAADSAEQREPPGSPVVRPATALFTAATELFLEHGEGVPIAQICAAAGAHPNQVTYYYGSKETALRRGRVCCRAARRQAGRGRRADAETVGDYTEKLVGSLLGSALPASNSSLER